MDMMKEKEAARIVSTYIEKEMSEYRKVTEKELRSGGITPEAKEAFSRKPYYGVSKINLKNRPVLR
ncbi:MAG: hypothetical protein K2K74_05765 [Lachnospiraceae bacterium]|nr:hypothetical protein [Lachnospiraceae bacterium]